MAEKPPAFQFYAKDFMTGTLTMTLAERGAYAFLLAYQWDAGSIPGDDTKSLGRVLGCTLAEVRRVWPAVSRKLYRRDDGTWVNERLEAARLKQWEYRAEASEHGKRGGRPRKGTDDSQKGLGFENGKPNESSPISNLQSPNPHPSGSEPKPHPIREFLSLHEQAFLAKTGRKPAKYTGKDAKIAERVIGRYGPVDAADLLRQFFASTDEFILRAGFGLNIFEGQINKLIAAQRPTASGTTLSAEEQQRRRNTEKYRRTEAHS